LPFFQAMPAGAGAAGGSARRGASGICLCGPFFIALVTGIFYIGMTYLGQAGLETVAEGASRMLLTGRAQTVRVTNASGGTDVGMSAADFKTPSATA
jgi:Flp pilus assembly protein TadG